MFMIQIFKIKKKKDGETTYNQETLNKSVDALFDGLSKGIQSLRMKDNAIQLKIFYLDSTPKSIISEGKVFIYLFILLILLCYYYYYNYNFYHCYIYNYYYY